MDKKRIKFNFFKFKLHHYFGFQMLFFIACNFPSIRWTKKRPNSQIVNWLSLILYFFKVRIPMILGHQLEQFITHIYLDFVIPKIFNFDFNRKLRKAWYIFWHRKVIWNNTNQLKCVQIQIEPSVQFQSKSLLRPRCVQLSNTNDSFEISIIDNIY